MKKIIHHIRRQPEYVRRQILHVTILVVGILLMLLWIYLLGVNIANPDTKTKINQDLKPFSMLKDNITNGYGNFMQPNSGTSQ